MSGKKETWDSFAAVLYEGEIYIEGGVQYNFYHYVDDYAAIEIDKKLISAGFFKDGPLVESKTFPKTGWYPIRIWLFDVGGGHGARGRLHGVADYGIGWNTNGCTRVNLSTKSQWLPIADPGDGKLLRSPQSVKAGTKKTRAPLTSQHNKFQRDVKQACKDAGKDRPKR